MKEPRTNQEERIASDTKKYDLRRNLFNGIVEAGFASTALLVAIRYFEASDSAKSLMAGDRAWGFCRRRAFFC